MGYSRQPSIFLSEDHDAFRQMVASFVEREIRPSADEWERAGHCHRELYKKAGDAGLLGLGYDEALGGGGLDFMATAVLAQELAKGDTSGAAVSLMAQSEFALAILADEASGELKAKMATRFESTRLLAYQAARLLSDHEPSGELALSMAKLHAAEAVQFVQPKYCRFMVGSARWRNRRFLATTAMSPASRSEPERQRSCASSFLAR